MGVWDEDPLPEETPDALDNRQVFLEERAHVIGSTDSPGILRLSRRSSPLSVYRRLTGETRERPPGLPAWLGARLENVVSELASAATGYTLRADNLLHIHPQHVFIGCHLDRRVQGQPWIIVELKTRSSGRGWGDDGSTIVPPDIYVQAQHQMAVTGARQVLVAVLFGLRDFRMYPIARNDSFITALLDKLVEFNELYVIPRVPPPATGNDEDTAWLQSLPGGRSDQMLPATPEQTELVRRYALARLNAAQADVALAEAKNLLRQLIGEDYDGLMTSYGPVYYRRTKDTTKVHWDTVASVYHGAAVRLLELVAPGDDPATVAELASLQAQVETALTLYTEAKEGVRRLTSDLMDEATEQMPTIAPPEEVST